MNCLILWFCSILSIPFLLLSVAGRTAAALIDAFFDVAVNTAMAVLTGILLFCLVSGLAAAVYVIVTNGLAEGPKLIGLTLAGMAAFGILILLDAAVLSFLGPLISLAVLIPVWVLGIAKTICEAAGNAGLAAHSVLIGRMMKQSGKG